MPPYFGIHLENAWWMFAGGVLVAVAIVLARGSRHFSLTAKKRSEREIEEETHEFGDGLKEQNRPAPLFIWLMVAAYFVWAVAYIVFSGRHGL
mgnify:CR=1 FL=1